MNQPPRNPVRTTWGVVAEFAEPEALIAAARAVRDAGYRRTDAYSPLPLDELPEALGLRASRVPWIVLGGGLLGGLGAYLMMWYSAVIDYPWNIGGRPLHSWPSFVPITFEMTILGAATCGTIGMLLLNRFPRPHHPVFDVPGFDRASSDRFFLSIEADDALFDENRTVELLENQAPLAVHRIAAEALS